MSLIECRNVCQSFGGQVLFSDVSFSLEAGEGLCLLGASGSGKSSLLRMLNRLDEGSGGQILYRGQPIQELDPCDLRQRVALVLQGSVLLAGSVRDNLLRRPGTAPHKDDAELLEELRGLGLEERMLERDVARLSGGEKQRVALARTLLTGPEVLLLDEPTAALDPAREALVADRVRKTLDEGGATIAVSHSEGFVRRIGGRLALMEDGDLHLDPPGARVESFFAGHSLKDMDP